MAVIIQHVKSDKQYILLGSGLGMYESTKPNWLLGDLVGDTSSGSLKAICACDLEGNITWLIPEEFRVVSVDGKSPEELLG
ncbi:hypothetical protein [Flavilitoribacter nigricans]|uniref:Uncharacterized protein n=1 Tax=Flavilitoribacter nigricans (strain ATCC 23147 / DSM 23189 / NBRC 102662 / NCIMB 1420 / SS-2) TaxID=1122177 RepID=A0A2D0NAQ6_FLAN2|nr:hypothetical protein [Flavilitoribacter nigricans]PHN05601.1 hypothetical protein CRP01_16570 [Flavilitoribacter nigricans DSM 23189 = NBRC 102662]